MGVYLRVKFERSNMILTGSRQRVILPPHTPKRTPKKSTQIRVNFDSTFYFIYIYIIIEGLLVTVLSFFHDLLKIGLNN